MRLTYNEHSPELFAELKKLGEPPEPRVAQGPNVITGSLPPGYLTGVKPHHRPTGFGKLDALVSNAGLQDFLGLSSLMVIKHALDRRTTFSARRVKCGHKIGFNATDATIENVGREHFCEWLCRMFDSLPCDCTPATQGTFEVYREAGRPMNRAPRLSIFLYAIAVVPSLLRDVGR